MRNSKIQGIKKFQGVIMRKALVSAVFFALFLSGCAGVQLKRPALKPEATKGSVLIFGKYIEPPYALEIVKLAEEGDQYAIYFNGTRVIPFTGSETLKECDRLAKSIESSIMAGNMVYFERGWEDGYQSLSNNNWPAIKALLDSKMTDKEKTERITGQTGGNSLLARHIVESNK
jgi:hypothetical protein